MANPLAAYSGIIQQAAAHYGIPPGLLERQILAESGGNARARSPVGALGLMQLMPSTARGLGVTNPFDPRQNIMGGAKYLADQKAKFGSFKLALAAYNAGPGAVVKYGGVPPYAETHDYINKILGGIPSVGAAPRESPPALTASAGKGVSAPTAPQGGRQGPNFMSMAENLAQQAQLPAMTTSDTAPLPGSTGGDQTNTPSPLDQQSTLDSAPAELPTPSPTAWQQFLPSQQPAQDHVGRALAPRIMPPTTGDPTGVVQAAKGYLGVPYKWGGTSRQTGMDCSGFLQNAFKDVGIKIPRTTYEQVKVGMSVPLNKIQPGDAVFTEPGHAGPNHVGLYIGHGMVQESPHTGTVNSIIPLKNYLGGGLVAIRRYTGLRQPQGRSGRR